MGKGSLYGEDTAPTSDDFYIGIDAAGPTTKKVKLSSIMKLIYPVGCIYTEITGTNPNTTFGFGTWTAFGSGKVPVGVNSGDPDFATVELSGGMKSHHHMQTFGADATFAYAEVDGSGSGFSDVTSVDRISWSVGSRATSASRRDGTYPESSLQPFITVYMWKRTA